MYIVIDASLSSDFVRGADDMRPIHSWLKSEKGGKIAYSAHEQIKKEIQRGAFREKLVQLSRKMPGQRNFPRRMFNRALTTSATTTKAGNIA